MASGVRWVFILFKVLNLISLSLKYCLGQDKDKLYLLCSSRAMALKGNKSGLRSQCFVCLFLRAQFFHVLSI